MSGQPALISSLGDNPRWPFNRLVAAFAKRGDQLDEHSVSANMVQALKGPCPCGQHKTPGRDFAFAEYRNGRVRAWTFTNCDLRVCLESLGLTLEDLRTTPDGRQLDKPTGEAVPAEPPDPLPELPRLPLASLTGPLKAFVDWGIKDGLHPECVAAAGLAALVTLTGPACLRMNDAKTLRAILWIVLIGIPSSGKSPAFEHAFSLIREEYAKQYESYQEELATWTEASEADPKNAGPRPAEPQALELDDPTIEAVARWLKRRAITSNGDASGAVIDDELAAYLEALNQYRGGRGADRSKWLKLWTGVDMHIIRVAAGGDRNEVDIYVRRPVASLAGPLVPDQLPLIGKPGSGFRPRWLPFYAPAVSPEWHSTEGYPKAWTGCLRSLLVRRDYREWWLTGPARTEWETAAKRWKKQQEQPEPDDVIEALRKADVQCLRVALVIAESLNPAAGHEVPLEAVTCAIALVDYFVDVWRVLPGNSSMITSRYEEVIDKVYRRFCEWLENREKGTEGLPEGGSPRPRAPRRQIQQWLHEKPAKVDALIREHAERWPGCVVDVPQPGGGLPTRYVYAPPRAVTGDDHRRTVDGVAATPETGSEPPSVDSETAGSEADETVLRTATPCHRNTVTATPLEDEEPSADGALFPFGKTPAARASVGWTAPEPVVVDPADMPAVAAILDGADVGLDIETTGLDPLTSDIRLIQLAAGNEVFVIDCARIPPQAIQPVIDSAGILVIHEGKFDLGHLAHSGISLPADLGGRVRDTVLASRLLTAGNRAEWNTLEAAAGRYLGVSLDKSLQASDWSGALSAEQLRYAATDAAVLLPLRAKLGEELKRAGLLHVMAMENKCLPALVWMEQAGAPFDLARHSAACADIDDRVISARLTLEEAVKERRGARGQDALIEADGLGINWDSPDQLKRLFAELGVEVADTAEATLVTLDDPVARLVLAYREVRKLQSTFGSSFASCVAPDGRIHPRFRQIGADTGRMSCTEPNLQQVPKAGGFRGMFRAPEGRRLIKADYSQIELRLAAQISGDKRLIEAFQAGEDLHVLTAREVLGREQVSKDDRQAAKALNFGLLYGMGADKLRHYAQATYGVTLTDQQAKDYRTGFFRTYSGLRAWHRRERPEVMATRTLTGRRRLDVRKFTEKLNTPVQGSGADGLKLALAWLFQRRDQVSAAFPVLTVHDEIVIECRAEDTSQVEAWLRGAMQDGMGEILKAVPVVVDTITADDWEGN